MLGPVHRLADASARPSNDDQTSFLALRCLCCLVWSLIGSIFKGSDGFGEFSRLVASLELSFATIVDGLERLATRAIWQPLDLH